MGRSLWLAVGKSFKTAGVQAFVVAGDPVFFNERDQLAQLALHNRLPSMFSQREYTTAGGLMSYGENLSDFYYRAAAFIDKVFKGAVWKAPFISCGLRASTTSTDKFDFAAVASTLLRTGK